MQSRKASQLSEPKPACRAEAPTTPAKSPSQPPCKPSDVSSEQSSRKRPRSVTPPPLRITELDDIPRVLQAGTLSKNEKQKVRRIVTPKEGSGRLEVPENIFEMWQDASKGRETLFQMWAKSGGVKDPGTLNIIYALAFEVSN